MTDPTTTEAEEEVGGEKEAAGAGNGGEGWEQMASGVRETKAGCQWTAGYLNLLVLAQ